MIQPTNQQLLEKQVEGTNMVLNQTYNHHTSEMELLEPTYSNVRQLLALVSELKDEVQALREEVRSLRQR